MVLSTAQNQADAKSISLVFLLSFALSPAQKQLN
jgi:hypothetical protein